MKKILYLSVILLILIFSSGCDKSNNHVFKSIDGEKIDFSVYKNKIILLNVFTSWCEYCKKLHPTLAELSKREDIVVIGAAIDDAEAVKKYMKDNNYDFPVFITTKKDMLKQFAKVNMFPTVYLIDKNGNYNSALYGALPKKIYEEYIDKM